MWLVEFWDSQFKPWASCVTLCHVLRAPAGYNVTRTMGVQLAKLSPSRGFAAELSTALVILVASQ